MPCRTVTPWPASPLLPAWVRSLPGAAPVTAPAAVSSVTALVTTPVATTTRRTGSSRGRRGLLGVLGHRGDVCAGPRADLRPRQHGLDSVRLIRPVYGPVPA